MVHLWLRNEVKPMEHRTALTPTICKKLIEKGYKITIEKSQSRCFSIDEYEKINCEIVEPNSWKGAPKDAIIIGLKELEETEEPLIHKHIYFAHCFKEQNNWNQILNRFKKGNGLLLDLEFLKDSNGRRVAAFGYYAGFTGCAVGIDLWSYQKNKKLGYFYLYLSDFPTIKPYKNEKELISSIQNRLVKAIEINNNYPKIMIMGALGRCGRGAVDLVKSLKIPKKNVIQWDIQETSNKSSFKEILECDIFINCIYLSGEITPFITKKDLNNQSRKLSVIVDVSCDYTSPYNPIPIYNQGTTFYKPTLIVSTNPILEIISIDHLPTMLPRESSEVFGNDLLPTLLELTNLKNKVWADAIELFEEKIKLL